MPDFSLLETAGVLMQGRQSLAPLNMEAIHSDFTSNYVNPPQPGSGEPVTISIRTARENVEAVWLIFEGGEYIDENLHSHTHIGLHLSRQTQNFDFYSATIPRLQGRLSYCFALTKNGRTYYYNRRGVQPTVDYLHNFVVIAGIDTPAWAMGALMYQIYVDRFYNGDSSNDVLEGEYFYLGETASRFESWESLPKNLDICNFAGGDLQGVIEKFPYLQSLGVEAIYLTPVFVSPSNHKYDIQDYDFIDPHIGIILDEAARRPEGTPVYAWRTTDAPSLVASNALMIRLIETAHEHGIKVLLDGVFNHCGAHNKWMDSEGIYSGREGYYPGAYQARQSPYHEYFRWHPGGNWPENNHYDSWWGHHNHPKLNYEGSKELYEYILHIGKKWVSPPFNADGWRIDVAADLGYSPELNHRFWKDFRKAVKKANPEAIILAEHYGDPTKWLQGDEWDTIMNYDAFMEPVTWFLTGMQKHSDEFKAEMLNNAMAFEDTMRREMGKFTVSSLQCAMNQLSNHDHSRFLTRTTMKPGRLHTHGSDAAGHGINRAIMAEAVVMQMTWPGAPTIYYGDEAGLTGWTDPDNRRTYPWGNEDTVLLSLHQELARIHKAFSALRTGSLEFLHGEFGVLAYARWDSSSRIIIVINNNYEPRALSIPVWRAEVTDGSLRAILRTNAEGHDTTHGAFPVVNGQMRYEAAPLSATIFVQQV